MKIMNIKDSQANLEILIAAALAGEEVYIARWKTPVAMVVSYEQSKDCRASPASARRKAPRSAKSPRSSS